jgi:hypothetical protein
MESNQRTELIDTLLEEAAQKIAVLEHATAAQEVSQEASHSTTHGVPNPQEHSTVQAERQSWEKVVQGLTEVRHVLEQIEQSERQRGVSASS